MNLLKLLVVGLIAILMCGCASKTEEIKTKVITYYPQDAGAADARIKMSEAAVSVSDSLNQLAAIEKATHPKEKLKPPLNADSIGLGALASVDWTGPVEPLVAQLAQAGHYKYRVVGRRPAVPVLVAVYAYNMPLGDILRDTNYQAGKKADIVIYPSQRIIELRYRYS